MKIVFILNSLLLITPILNAENIPERILAIQQGFNEKYDTENFLKQLDGQLGSLNKIDDRIKNFKQWVEKKTDNILYHMEHNNDMSTPNLLIKMLYAKKMIQVSSLTSGKSESSNGSQSTQAKGTQGRLQSSR